MSNTCLFPMWFVLLSLYVHPPFNCCNIIRTLCLKIIWVSNSNKPFSPFSFIFLSAQKMRDLVEVASFQIFPKESICKDVLHLGDLFPRIFP